MNRSLTALTSAFVAVVSLCVFAAGEAAEAKTDAEASQDGEVREAMFAGRKVKIRREGGEWVMDLNEMSAEDATNAPAAKASAELPGHKPDDVFLSITGEVVTWGEADENIDLLMLKTPLGLPKHASEADAKRVVALTRRKFAERMTDTYVKAALLAQLAKKEGLSVSEEEMRKVIRKSVRRVKTEHRASILAKISNPKSFFYRYEENYLLTQMYRDTKLKEGLAATEEEIRDAIRARESEIAELKEANARMRPELEALLADLKAGRRDFGEAAFDVSDAYDTDESGSLPLIERDEAEDDLCAEYRDFAFGSTTNEYSGVIETEHAFAVLKAESRNVVNGEVVAVRLGKIERQKHSIPDAFDHDDAEAFVLRRKLGMRLIEAQRAAIRAADLKSVFAVRDPGAEARRPRKTLR